MATKDAEGKTTPNFKRVFRKNDLVKSQRSSGRQGHKQQIDEAIDERPVVVRQTIAPLFDIVASTVHMQRRCCRIRERCRVCLPRHTQPAGTSQDVEAGGKCDYVSNVGFQQ